MPVLVDVEPGTLDAGSHRSLERSVHAAYESDRARTPLRAVRRHGPDHAALRASATYGSSRMRLRRTAPRYRTSTPESPSGTRRRSASIRPRTSAPSGDPGAIFVTDDDDVVKRARLIRNYGERERYLFGRRAAVNSRLDTLQAAVLLAKLPFLEDWTARRRALAERYLGALSDSGLGLPLEASERVHAYHLFVVRTPEREQLREVLARDGIGTLVPFPRPIHGHPGLRAARTRARPRGERGSLS